VGKDIALSKGRKQRTIFHCSGAAPSCRSTGRGACVGLCVCVCVLVCVRIADQALMSLYCFFGRATVPSCGWTGRGACAVVLRLDACLCVYMVASKYV